MLELEVILITSKFRQSQFLWFKFVYIIQKWMEDKKGSFDEWSREYGEIRKQNDID